MQVEVADLLIIWDIRFAERILILLKDEGQYNNSIEIFWASGACLFVRACSFWEVGGLDKDFFAHQEIDLCWRLKIWGIW